jgi:hypothetical protein
METPQGYISLSCSSPVTDSRPSLPILVRSFTDELGPYKKSSVVVHVPARGARR